MQYAENRFAQQDSVQISPDTELRDCRQHEGDPDADSGSIMQKTGAGFAQAVKNAGEGGVHIQKRTDKGHSMNIDSGSRALKQQNPQHFSEKEKQKRAGSAQEQAAEAHTPGYIPDAFPVTESLQLSNRRSEHHRGGIGDSGRKKKQGQSHTGKNSVDAQRLFCAEAVHAEPLGNQNHFNTA